jgi:CRP-like cAMP-binding protein
MQSFTARPIAHADIDLALEAMLFSGFDAGSLAMLLEGASVVTYHADAMLFSRGDPADRFFVVLAGQVRLMALTEDGSQTVVEIFKPVSTFAEAALFASKRFPLSAEVGDGSRLIHVSAGPFMKKLPENRDMLFKMLAALSTWHRHLMQEITELKMKSPGQRLGSYLLSLVNEENGEARVKLPLKKTVIASRIGITPESLSRAMSRLRSIGVTSEGNSVSIVDVQALRAFCNESDIE